MITYFAVVTTYNLALKMFRATKKVLRGVLI